MPVIKMKPTSPGTRFVVKTRQVAPVQGWSARAADRRARSAIRAATTSAASPRATRAAVTYHKYRIIDFKRDKDGIKGVVERLEHDPNRTATSRWCKYSDGERRYIIAAKGMTPGDEIRSGADSPIKSGNAMQLRHIPVGSIVHNIELKPGKGGQMARSAGSSASFTAREGIYATLRLKSGESRKVHVDCRATIGEVSNDEHNLRVYGKAGAKRWLGIRPTVRGQAMNPVDHPHGGGEGKSGQGNPHPVSPWGQNAKGLKTRAINARPA